MRVLRTSSVKKTTREFGISTVVLTFAAVIFVGCGGPTSSSSSQFASGRSASSVTAGQITDAAHQLQNPSNKQLYEQARATSLSDMFTNSLNLAPSSPVQLGGHTFDNLHDQLAQHASDLQMISDTYGTVGSYFDAMGFTSLADVTQEDLQATYDMLDEVINKGAASNQQGSTEQTGTAPTAVAASQATGLPGATELGLLSTWGCIGSAIGAVGASVGAGFECVATLGSGCAAGALGAMAAGAGAVNACKDTVANLFKKKTPTPPASTQIQNAMSCPGCSVTLHQPGQPDTTVSTAPAA